LYEEVVLGFPLPVWERDRVRGKVVAPNLLTQMKSAVETLSDLTVRMSRGLISAETAKMAAFTKTKRLEK
jgi:hypothetical protein